MENNLMDDLNIYQGLSLDKRIEILNKSLNLSNIDKNYKKYKNIKIIQEFKNDIYEIVTNKMLFIENEKSLEDFIKNHIKYYKNSFSCKKLDCIHLNIYNNINDIINTYGYFELRHLYMYIDSN